MPRTPNKDADPHSPNASLPKRSLPARRRSVTLSISLGVIALLIVMGIAAAAIWVLTPYRATAEAQAEIRENTTVTFKETDTALVMTPKAPGSPTGTSTGNDHTSTSAGSNETPVSDSGKVASAFGETHALLFVPGARVDYLAYRNNLLPLVEDGWTVVITKPKLNLAILDTRELNEFTAAAPEIDQWVVGGHSMGGVKACEFAKNNPEDVSGLLLAGSYCSADLSHESNLEVLSLRGSRDGLTSSEDIETNKQKLPADARFMEIEGMNHAQFGSYGEQSGDNQPTISNYRARTEFVKAVQRSVSTHAG